MNKHFRDTRYYLKRAGETTKAGVAEELEPVEARVREFGARVSEPEPQPRRFETVRVELAGFGTRLEGQTRSAIRAGREKIAARRDRTAA